MSANALNNTPGNARTIYRGVQPPAGADRRRRQVGAPAVDRRPTTVCKYQRSYPTASCTPRSPATTPSCSARRPGWSRRRGPLLSGTSDQLFFRADLRPAHRPQAAGRVGRADDRPEGAAGRLGRRSATSAAPSSRSTRRPARSSPWSASRRTTRTRSPTHDQTAAQKAYERLLASREQAADQPRHRRRLYPPARRSSSSTAAAALSTGKYTREHAAARRPRCSTCRSPPRCCPTTTGAVRAERPGEPRRRAARSPATPRSAPRHDARREGPRGPGREVRLRAPLQIPLPVTPSSFPHNAEPGADRAGRHRPVRRPRDAAADGHGRRRDRQPRRRHAALPRQPDPLRRPRHPPAGAADGVLHGGHAGGRRRR